MNPIIWWIRKDLRLSDNEALKKCLNRRKDVIPLFILDPTLLRSETVFRKDFLFSGLANLDDQLKRRGNKLIIREGSPIDVLKGVMNETTCDSIIAEEDYSPYAQKRDDQVMEELPIEFVKGSTIIHPEIIKKKTAEPYARYSPYKNEWLNLQKEEYTEWFPENHIPTLPEIDSLPIRSENISDDFPVGEIEAKRRLEAFLSKKVFSYANQRDILGVEGTSMLSPYIRFGMISINRVLYLASRAMKNTSDEEETLGVKTWIQELIWREFYISILYHYPKNLYRCFNPTFESVRWRASPQDFSAWKNGETGFPLVDACMRQLKKIGWMHNRGRMIAASFLVKDLLLDWKLGEKWFMRMLIDADPAANNGGWQWVAGVGADAAPYFRILNPILQGEKFDRNGKYIKKWIPELRDVPLSYIHQPWLMPRNVQQKANCVIGKKYPEPVTERKMARERALNAYKEAKKVFVEGKQMEV